MTNMAIIFMTFTKQPNNKKRVIHNRNVLITRKGINSYDTLGIHIIYVNHGRICDSYPLGLGPGRLCAWAPGRLCAFAPGRLGAWAPGRLGACAPAPVRLCACAPVHLGACAPVRLPGGSDVRKFRTCYFWWF